MASFGADKKYVRVAVGIVIRDGDVLICRRKDDAILGGYWEFPGGKLEPNESPEQAAVRELDEELDIHTQPIRSLTVLKHEYDHAHVELHPILCQILSGTPKTIGCQAFLWVSHADLNNYLFPAANGPLIQEIQQLLG